MILCWSYERFLITLPYKKTINTRYKKQHKHGENN